MAAHMAFLSRQAIIQLCRKYDMRPSRSSGQNFLVSEKTLDQIIGAADLKKDDVVLEIGAGFGTLTVALADRVRQVVAVELDKRLAAALRVIAATTHAMSIVEGDIFDRWPAISSQLPADLQYKLVSNVPYNITSLVLRNFLEQKPRPKEMVLLVQAEVAERVVAPPGRMSVLSVAVQFMGRPQIIAPVSRKNFWPEPAVDSAILKISAIGTDPDHFQEQLGSNDFAKFMRVVKIGFAARRKQLHNNLSGGLRLTTERAVGILQKIGLGKTVRAQELTLSQWVSLAKEVFSEI